MQTRAEEARARRVKLRAAGLCYACGTKPAAPGKHRCEPCIAWLASYELVRREQRSASGLCPKCGRCSPEPGRAACRTCLDYTSRKSARYAQKNMAKMRARRAEAGLCAVCGAAPHEPGRRSCAPCTERELARSHEYRRRRDEREGIVRRKYTRRAAQGAQAETTGQGG